MDVCVLVYPRKKIAYIELYLMPEIIMGIIWYLRNIGPLRKKRIDYDLCHISRNNEKNLQQLHNIVFVLRKVNWRKYFAVFQIMYKRV